jgi:hypothetical protein
MFQMITNLFPTCCGVGGACVNEETQVLGSLRHFFFSQEDFLKVNILNISIFLIKPNLNKKKTSSIKITYILLKTQTKSP